LEWLDGQRAVGAGTKGMGHSKSKPKKSIRRLGSCFTVREGCLNVMKVRVFGPRGAQSPIITGWPNYNAT